MSCSPGTVVACSVACGRVMLWYGNVGLGAVRSVMRRYGVEVSRSVSSGLGKVPFYCVRLSYVMAKHCLDKYWWGEVPLCDIRIVWVWCRNV